MLKIRDRIYGLLELPDEAWRLATSCGVLLRLREIRMANIPFLSYPSFANVDRYEHSLGAAHLAWRWARNNRLPDDVALGLTLAALYHDGGTPAFGHLFEEYLFRFGWNHESALVDLLLGRTDLPGRTQAQVFLGEYCKLEEVLNSSPLGPPRVTQVMVADLASGDLGLGRLIKGDLDFDNIDNVLRASSAMGLTDLKAVHPYEVIEALVWEDGQVRIRPDRHSAVRAWSTVRHELYDSIMNNPHEFRAQTAIKWAIEVCAEVDPVLGEASAWLLTDPMLMFQHLQEVSFSAALVDRVRKGRPPDLLFSAWLDDLSPLLGPSGAQIARRLRLQLEEGLGMKVYLNYYLDKRRRAISMELSQEPLLFPVSDSSLSDMQASCEKPPGGILGLVGVSAAEYLRAQTGESTRSEAAARKRSFGVADFCSTVESVLNQPIRVASQGWIGTQEIKEQLPLFAVI